LLLATRARQQKAADFGANNQKCATYSNAVWCVEGTSKGTSAVSAISADAASASPGALWAVTEVAQYLLDVAWLQRLDAIGGSLGLLGQHVCSFRNGLGEQLGIEVA
jgi:hypothetical protein